MAPSKRQLATASDDRLDTGKVIARALARLTQEHDAYRWICGGVSINVHTLSDFRSDQARRGYTGGGQTRIVHNLWEG